jgi:hypothetical protein
MLYPLSYEGVALQDTWQCKRPAFGQPLSEFCVEPADATILCKEDEELINLQIISACTTGPGPRRTPYPSSRIAGS